MLIISKILISAASENTVLKLSSKQYFKQSEYVQISEIFYQQGNWFCNLYNLNQQKWFIARCDQNFLLQSYNQNW